MREGEGGSSIRRSFKEEGFASIRGAKNEMPPTPVTLVLPALFLIYRLYLPHVQFIARGFRDSGWLLIFS